MKQGFIAASAGLLACVFISTAAKAQNASDANPPCSPRQAIIDRLSNTYSETAVAIGMASNGGIVEVLAAHEDAGTWTIIVTMPDGISCMLASGQHFEMLDAATPAKGDPA